MHQRLAGKLNYSKKGNAYLYEIPLDHALLKHPLYCKLINWFENKHPMDLNNAPQQRASQIEIMRIIKDILLPIEKHLGEVTITYGFNSAKLNTYIQANNPNGTSPKLDQHSSFEVNSLGNRISENDGFACDFYVKGYEQKMGEVVKFITNKLNFDKIYFYGCSRPVHVSVSSSPQHHLQLMLESENGRRVPGRKAYGEQAKFLAERLQ
ncbi:hypothetical protein [Catenovulum agarivorans]|nr:hypothetical protein [Catenovulum agarivorans]